MSRGKQEALDSRLSGCALPPPTLGAAACRPVSFGTPEHHAQLSSQSLSHPSPHGLGITSLCRPQDNPCALTLSSALCKQLVSCSPVWAPLPPPPGAAAARWASRGVARCAPAGAVCGRGGAKGKGHEGVRQGAGQQGRLLGHTHGEAVSTPPRAHERDGVAVPCAPLVWGMLGACILHVASTSVR